MDKSFLRAMAKQAEAEHAATPDPYASLNLKTTPSGYLLYSSFLANQFVYDDLKFVDFPAIVYDVLTPNLSPPTSSPTSTSTSTSTITIHQDKKQGKGGLVWCASFILGEYISTTIEFSPSLSSSPLNILELGSGTGLASIYLSAFLETSQIHSSITTTDLPSLLPLLEQNVAANRHESKFSTLTPSILSWGVDDGNFSPDSFDYIIGADIVTSLYDPVALASTIHTLANASTKVYISFKGREQVYHDKFEAAMNGKFVESTVELMGDEGFGGRNRNPGVGILFFTGKI